MHMPALTPQEQRFAAEHYRLIFKFMHRGGFAKDEYFDIVAFGFLEAVHRYHAEPGLRRYAFSTIAWRGMRRCVSDYLRAESRQKRKHSMISLDAPMAAEDKADIQKQLYAQNDAIHRLEMNLLMHDLYLRVSKDEMNIIRMRMAGYTVKEIAGATQMTVRGVSVLLAKLLNVVRDVCYGLT